MPHGAGMSGQTISRYKITGWVHIAFSSGSGGPSRVDRKRALQLFRGPLQLLRT